MGKDPLPIFLVPRRFDTVGTLEGFLTPTKHIRLYLTKWIILFCTPYISYYNELTIFS